MEKQIRYYAPDTSAGSNPGETDSDEPGSRGMSDANVDPGDLDEDGTSDDGANKESGVLNPSDEGIMLTGTDRDETAPGENMATES